ncbi:hypothetical protein [Halorussus salinus]|uniref:hypothetical protein n=1 Tax=Halorussus salinus TaxID=1364935 RepID=UPI001091ECDE|nr:hypothetical protein [Halorussus salinus]
MMGNNKSRFSASQAIAIALVSLIAFGSLTAAAGPTASTAVSLSSTSEQVTVGDTTTFEVVVESADDGVGVYTANVTLENPSIASITGVEVAGDPRIKDVNITDDDSSVRIDAALMNTTDTGSVTIATVTVEGDATGNSDVSLSIAELGDEDGNAYTVTETPDATLDVQTSGDTNNDDDTDGGNSNADSSDQGNAMSSDATTANTTSGVSDTEHSDTVAAGTTTGVPGSGDNESSSTVADGEKVDRSDDLTAAATDSGPGLVAVSLLVVTLAALIAGLIVAFRRR